MSRKKGKSKPRSYPKGTFKGPNTTRPSSSRPVQLAFSSALRPMASRPTAAFDIGTKLRQKPICFVTAGHLPGTIEERPPIVKSACVDSVSGSESVPASIAVSSSSSPVTDNAAAMAHLALRSPSPSLSESSSSQDEVVFRGRGQELRPRIDLAGTPRDTERCNVAKSSPLADSAPASDSDDIIQDHFATRRGSRPIWEGTTTEWHHRSKPDVGWLSHRDRPDLHAFLRGDVDSRDAAEADYMQNVQDFGLTVDAHKASDFALREMDLDAGSYNYWESASDSHTMQRDRPRPREHADVPEVPTGAPDESNSWELDRLHDLTDMSTSSDVDLHEQQQSNPSDPMEADDDTDDDEAYDDELLARVLQMEEELGEGSYSDPLYASDEVFDAPFSCNSRSFEFPSKPKKLRQSRGRDNREPWFPSASAMADALSMDPYGGFDIMDTERPSLRAKKTGRRGQMPPELDDANLLDQIQSTWANDRAKKRLRKAEREQLRLQGLLGRKDKAPNLKVKYMGGTTMEDVVGEIRDFMTGSMQSLALPPMDAYRRATVHQAASFFHLTSRSRGDGRNRFTVLAKTGRTRNFTGDEFDVAIRHKGFLKRLQGPLYREAAVQPGAVFRSGARNKPQTGYRDGETVGADAPALGPENKGHALLSKMGWSKGMGLGARDNQGILQPIAHTVKTTKAGLQ